MPVHVLRFCRKIYNSNKNIHLPDVRGYPLSNFANVCTLPGDPCGTSEYEPFLTSGQRFYHHRGRRIIVRSFHRLHPGTCFLPIIPAILHLPANDSGNASTRSPNNKNDQYVPISFPVTAFSILANHRIPPGNSIVKPTNHPSPSIAQESTLYLLEHSLRFVERHVCSTRDIHWFSTIIFDPPAIL